MFDSLVSSARHVSVAESIRKRGFLRWHERQLIEAHAGLVTAFLSLIMVVICWDQFRSGDGGFRQAALYVALTAAGIALCYKAVTLYFRGLFLAEHFASQAVCSACQTYGRIEVLALPAVASPGAGDTVDGDWFRVRCRKCGHDWT